MDYYNRVNQDLLQFIPQDAGLVVEAGCGAGALGEIYRQTNPYCRYVGLEINPEAAKLAAARLSAVIVGDAGAIELAEENIDCLVYGDVLEHLTDPWRTLQRHAAKLREGGQVIACIPNIGHWTIILGLLKGEWQYREEGLLDATHLRFFTLEGISELFTRAGLTVFDVRARKVHQQGHGEFVAALTPLVEKLGVDPAAFAAQTGAFQYIVRAVKGPPARPLFIRSLLGETKVCARVRIEEPHAFLATIPGVHTQSAEKTISLADGQADADKIFIWQRVHIDDPGRQKELLRRGYLTVAEIDDDPRRWPLHEQNDFLTFRSCHAVQVSTEPLAAFLRQYNPHVAVFPNQLAYLPPPRDYQQGPIRLFFGALNREDDWQPIMPELNRVLAAFAGRVEVGVIHDRRFFDALATTAKVFTPFCRYRDYEAALRRCDIAILPLAPTDFNNMKSDLKFLECAGHGVVALASPTVYAGSIVDGRTGLIYKDPGEFAAKLAGLIEDRALRKRLAGNAYAWVAENRLLCRHYRQRYEWYRHLLARRADLTREIGERVPALAGADSAE